MSLDLEKQKLAKLVELGERVHMLAREGQINDADLKMLSRQLTDIEKQANASYGKKLPKREDGICPKCSAPFEGSFCTNCGLNIDEFFVTPMPVCDVCKFVVKEEDVFCGVCGSKRGA